MKKDSPGRRTKASGLNMGRRNKFLYLTGALGDAFLMVSFPFFYAHKAFLSNISSRKAGKNRRI